MSLSGPATKRASALRSVFYGLVVVLVGGIVHLVTILAMPRLASRDVYATVRDLAGDVPLRTIPVDPSRRRFPDADPAMADAFCLYDLTQGAVRVSVGVGDVDFLGLSLHSRHGRVFYGLTDRSASHGALALTLMTAAQIAEADARESGDDATDELRVQAPEAKGFVAVQVLAVAPSARAGADRAARGLKCAPANSK